MVRLFRHYFSKALLTLLVAESLHLFLSIYVGRSLRMALVEQGSWPSLTEVSPTGLTFSLVMITIMVAMGLYERNFWDGKSDMLLRVGISFLFGIFTMTIVYYLFPELHLNRGEFSLAAGIAFGGVLLLRFLFINVSDYELLKRRVLVLGVGQNAVQLEELAERKRLDFLIMGYIQIHEDENPQVQDDRMLQVTGSLYDLAEKLHINEIVVAMDDRRGSLGIAGV